VIIAHAGCSNIRLPKLCIGKETALHGKVRYQHGNLVAHRFTAFGVCALRRAGVPAIKLGVATHA